MRAHAKLVEYAPFVLALMALIELARGTSPTLGVTVAVVVVARIAHPIGMDLLRSDVAWAGGAILTWLELAFLVGWVEPIATGVA